MTLKGHYNQDEAYNSEDVFLWNGDAYRVLAAAQANPATLLNCVRLDRTLSDCAQMIMSYQPPAPPMPHETAPATTKTTRKKKEN